MSDKKDEKNELVVKEKNHVDYIDKNLDLIQNQNKLSADDLRNFAIQCKRTGLDPITRQIYAIPNNGKLTIMASIDGLRLIAERSGAYEGQTRPEWCGEDGKWTDIWLSKEPPKAARIGVYKTKFREALYGVALFDEYAGRHAYDDSKYGKFKKGDLTFMWAKMPALMIAKVAEALALRKAFPNEMSGIYSDEEMQQANIERTVDTPKEESKTGPQNPSEYIIKFGKKMAGKKIKDFSIEDHRGMLTWLEDQSKKANKPISGPALEYFKHAEAFIIEQSKNEPKFDSSENIPL